MPLVGFLFFSYHSDAWSNIHQIQPNIRWVMGSCLAEKQWKHEIDRASSSSAEIKSEWSCTSTPPMYLHGADRDNCAFFNCCWKNFVIIFKKRRGSWRYFLWSAAVHCVCSVLEAALHVAQHHWTMFIFMNFSPLHCWLQWLPEFLLLDCEALLVCWLQLCLIVGRLYCTDGSEFLFLAATEREMEDWVNKISFHAKLPPSLQLLRYDDIQKVRWCEEQLLYSIVLEKHNIEDSDRPINEWTTQPPARLTNRLTTPWSRALFKKLIVPELLKNLSMFCGMKFSFLVFAAAHRILSWTR